MKNKLLICLSLLSPSIAYAHGEDILEPILSQFAVLLVVVSYIIFSNNNLKNKFKLFLGLIVGIIFGWVCTMGIDYNNFLKHHVIITTFVSVFPLLTTFITYKIVKSNQ
jgi:hypothetical protein